MTTMALGDCLARLSTDGSLDRLAVDECLGVLVERVGTDLVVVRIDKPGEESIFVNVRAVGRTAGLRVVVLEAAG